MNIVSELNITFDFTISKKISEVALTNGFELYSAVMNCPPNKYMDLVMKGYFRSFKSPRDLLQGTVNLIYSGIITNSASMTHLYLFCQKLQDILNINIKNILPKVLKENDVILLRQISHPFLIEENNSSYDGEEKKLNSIAETSSHPVHLKTRDGSKLPSAFIPFCAYKTSMLLLGEYIDGFEFPVCNKFTPTVLDGQLCFKLDVSSIVDPSDRKTEEGKRGTLMLLLDYNKERSIEPKDVESKANRTTHNDHINLEDTPDEEDQEARIFIHTLKRFSS